MLPTQRSMGFTLLELLAVIAVVATLAALLFPMGVSMVEKAQQAKCTSNLRQIGVAIHTYMAEHDGYYPPGRGSKVGGGGPFLYDTLADAGVTPQAGQSYRSAGIWYCPSDEGRPPGNARQSYGVNVRLGSHPDTPAWQRKPAASERSGQLIYLIDHDTGHKPKRTAGNLDTGSWPLRNPTSPDSPPASGNQVEFRHKGGIANALFVDGSVQAMTYADLEGTNPKYIIPE